MYKYICGRQSSVKIEKHSVVNSNCIIMFKAHSRDLPLRAGLVYCVWMHERLMCGCNVYKLCPSWKCCATSACMRLKHATEWIMSTHGHAPCAKPSSSFRDDSTNLKNKKLLTYVCRHITMATDHSYLL